MRVALTQRFQSDVAALSAPQRALVFETMLGLPRVFGMPHRHSGAGLRKLHASGIFEARVGLGLRVVFAIDKQTMILHRVGTHDAIRRYLGPAAK